MLLVKRIYINIYISSSYFNGLYKVYMLGRDLYYQIIKDNPIMTCIVKYLIKIFLTSMYLHLWKFKMPINFYNF
jgi:hypothetical protein